MPKAFLSVNTIVVLQFWRHIHICVYKLQLTCASLLQMAVHSLPLHPGLSLPLLHQLLSGVDVEGVLVRRLVYRAPDLPRLAGPSPHVDGRLQDNVLDEVDCALTARDQDAAFGVVVAGNLLCARDADDGLLEDLVLGAARDGRGDGTVVGYPRVCGGAVVLDQRPGISDASGPALDGLYEAVGELGQAHPADGGHVGGGDGLGHLGVEGLCGRHGLGAPELELGPAEQEAVH